jgi:DNA-binding MarR family transcriptional regulator
MNPVDNDWKAKEAYTLFTLLAQTVNTMMAARQKELASSGVSIKRYIALWGVSAMGRPATVAEVSHVVGREHHTTAQLLRRMEKEELLERHQGLYKNNTIAFTLTEKGKGFLRKGLEKNEVMDQIISCLSESEINNLKEYLLRLRKTARVTAVEFSTLPEPIASKLGV